MATAIPALGMTAEQQRAFYEEQGYLVFPQVLGELEVAALRAALAEVLQDAEGLTQSDNKFAISRGRDGGYHVRRIFSPIAYHESFRDLVFNPRILDIVENLIGPNIQLHFTNLNLKPPGCDDAAFIWHQEFPCAPHTNFDLVAVMVLLDDATEDNGCLQLIPGSHKWGPVPHLFDGGGKLLGLQDPSLVARSTVISVPVPAGGMELHHCNTLHGSAQNSGTDPRTAVVIWYRAADNVAIAGSRNHAGFGMMVRGEDPHWVRMVEGVFALPGGRRSSY